jgi:DNA repair protein RadC
MQEHKYPINQWAKDDRPREKLLYAGAENLSHSELLAILIHNGTRQKSAIDLAKEVLKLGQDNLVELGKLSVRELMKIKGIGEAKAITIVAALELGRRRQAADPLQRDLVRSSQDIASLLQARFEVVSEGGITGTVADPRIILRKALEQDAVSLVLCHNHPSGSLRPSRADEQLTQKIKEAASFLDITVLDHIIVSEDGYFSFADEGLI